VRDVVSGKGIIMVKTLLVLIVLALPGLVCSAQKPLVIVKNDQGKTVVASVGIPFTIALEGNASTGFSWNLRSLDTARLKMAGSGRYVGRDTLPGTSGTFYLDFTPIARGTSTVTLTYNREFEAGVVPEDSFSVVIKVK
jgi:predicted secreted protein